MTEGDWFSLSLADIVSSAGKEGDGRPFKLVGLRQYTAEPLAPYLAVGARDIDLELEVVWGGFDTMMQDALDPSFPLEAADAVLICPAVERIAPEIFQAIVEDEAERDAAVVVVAERMREFVAAVRARTNSPIVVIGWPENNFGVGISQQKILGNMVAALSFETQRLTEETDSVWFVDTAAVAAWVGGANFIDPLRNHRSAIPFSESGLRHIASEILIYLRNINGRVKKVLVLDCDNTLWGGLCGELEDIADLEIGSSGFPSAAHAGLQSWALDLKSRGVLLTLVSKNEAENVWRVFEQHPSMVLSKTDLAAWRINWAPKAQNIKELAEELNVGLDSVIFVDDQPIEIDSVRDFLPEVTCIHLDEKTLLNIRNIARRSGWLETLQVTDTDRQRTGHFRAEKERKKVQDKAIDFDSYLRNLEMIATLKIDDAVNFSRAEQMCARTNQMNLTTKRHSSADIEAFAKASNSIVISVGVADRLGDLGDVGLGILSFEADTLSARVETVLLSCRAFSRKCEELLFVAMIQEAKNWGALTMNASYQPTKKNTPASLLLEKIGFEVEVQQSGSKTGVLEIDEGSSEFPEIFEGIKTER